MRTRLVQLDRRCRMEVKRTYAEHSLLGTMLLECVASELAAKEHYLGCQPRPLELLKQ